MSPKLTQLLCVLMTAMFVVTLLGISHTAFAASRTEYVVAPYGKDTNTGARYSPFASIARAQHVVREEIARGLDRSITIVIRGGTYYLPDGLIIGPDDSGTPQYAITYKAYPGETPKLIGGIPITGWQRYTGQILMAEMPTAYVPNQLFEAGQRLEPARTPNQGYLKTEGPVPGKIQTDFIYKAGDVQPKGWDIADATVFMWPSYDWFSVEKRVTAIDAATRTITLGSTDDYAITPNNRYLFRNALAFLDQPGECVIATSRKRLYLWPRNAKFDQRSITAATAPHLVAIRGDGERLVRNVHIIGLDLSIAAGDAVQITKAEDCSVQQSVIENGRGHGVLIEGHAQRVVLKNNLIRFHGHHGVALFGLHPGQPDVNHHHTVENNHIHHCGRLVGHGYGIEIVSSGHNRVLHNEIHHMPRYGTGITGMVLSYLKETVKEATAENRYQYIHSNGNLLAYNHVHHVNLDSQDTGAMESWGPGRDNVYDYNLIHDVGNTELDIQSGIYLDDASNYFTVTNNIVYNVIGAGMHNQPIFSKGIGNRIENNILVVGPTNGAAIGSFEMAGEAARQHTYRQNIIYISQPGAAIYHFVNWSDDRIAACDRNIYWAPDEKLVMRGDLFHDKPYDFWRNYMNRKFEAGSIVADPRFVNVAKHDYRLQENSPALQQGFIPIKISEIGLTKDFPKRLRAMSH